MDSLSSSPFLILDLQVSFYGRLAEGVIALTPYHKFVDNWACYNFLSRKMFTQMDPVQTNFGPLVNLKSSKGPHQKVVGNNFMNFGA